MEDSKRRSLYISLVLMLCFLILVLYYFGERSDLFMGVGSDGVFLADFIPYFPHHLEHKSYPAEAVARFLPVIIARGFYMLLGFFQADAVKNLEFGDFEIDIHSNLIDTFRYLNVIYLCLSVVIFSYILYKRNFSFRVYCICIVLFLCNFMFLKQFFFEPVFLDQFYLLYAILLLYAVVFNKTWLQYILLFVSFFVSTLSIILCLLLLFISNDGKYLLRISRKFVLMVFTVFYIAVSMYLLIHPLCTEHIENRTMQELSYLTIVLSLSYLVILIFLLVPATFAISFRKNVILYAVFFTGLASFFLVRKAIGKTYGFEMCEGLEESLANKLINNIRQVNSRPLGFLASHFDYFGFVIIFLFFSARHVKNFLDANQKYIPFMLFFIFSTLTSESRYLTSFLPFLFLIFFEKFDHSSEKFRFVLSVKGIAALLIFNLAWSGGYLHINPLDTASYSNIINGYSDFSPMFSDPLQKYFRHLGPWTNNESYVFQLSVFLSTLFCLLAWVGYRAYSRKNKLITK